MGEPEIPESRRPYDRLRAGVVAGMGDDYLMRSDYMRSFNAPGNLVSFPLTSSLLRQRAFSFDRNGSEGFWDTYPGSLPFYVDRAHDVPEGAARFYPIDHFQPASGKNSLFPGCYIEAYATGRRFGNESPCFNMKLSAGGQPSIKSTQQD